MAADGARRMLVLHAAVTLVTAIAVRYADVAVLAVAAVLRRVVPRRLTPPPADRPLPTRPVPPLELPARRARLLTVADRPARSSGLGLIPTLTRTHHRRTPMSRTLLRAGTLLGTTALVALAGAAPAFAHVTANPSTIQKGGYGVVTFRVPDEDDTAGTIALTVSLPTDHPFSSVRTTPVAGWAVTTNEVALNPPLKDDDGNAITKTIGSVTWKANPGNKIPAGAVPRLPALARAVPGQRRRHPDAHQPDLRQREGRQLGRPAQRRRFRARAPGTVGRPDRGDQRRLTRRMSASAAPADPPSSSDDTTARWLGGAGVLVGALGLGFGGGALLRTRRAGKSD